MGRAKAPVLFSLATKEWESRVARLARTLNCDEERIRRLIVRAVGSACTKNPMAYIIPCHRIVHKGVAASNVTKGSPRKRKFLQWDTKAVEGRCVR
jgi:O-6-methylguanine DNA methyltransferase